MVNPGLRRAQNDFDLGTRKGSPPEDDWERDKKEGNSFLSGLGNKRKQGAWDWEELNT